MTETTTSPGAFNCRCGSMAGGDETIALAPFDAPLSPLEMRLTGAMAPLARRQSARPETPAQSFPLPAPCPGAPSGLPPRSHLFVAAEIGGSAEERAALAQALDGGRDAFAPAGSPALREAFVNAAAIGGPIGLDDARRAAALARRISVG